MSLLQSFRNLSPGMRLTVGGGLLAWGAVGLYLSDRAEERYGLTPTEKDKEELSKMSPIRVRMEDRDQGGSSSGNKSQ